MVSPKKWSGTVKAMKKHKEIDNPFALAWSMKKKGYKPHYKEMPGKSSKDEGEPEKKEKYKNEDKPKKKKSEDKKENNKVFETFEQWFIERSKNCCAACQKGDFAHCTCKKKVNEEKWIQKAINPEHKGYCTPITKKHVLHTEKL